MTQHIMSVMFVLIVTVIMAGGTVPINSNSAPAAASNATSAVTAPATSSCDNTTALKGLMSACQAYVVGMMPLPMWGSGASACCTALRSMPLSCLCGRSSSIPPYILQLINMQAVKNVVKTCGLQIPSGTTCGGVNLGN